MLFFRVSFTLYFTVINHSHECDYKLSPVSPPSELSNLGGWSRGLQAERQKEEKRGPRIGRTSRNKILRV